VPGPSSPPASVDWTGANTYHWDDWTLADLTAAKGSRAVSLVVPARNEAATVGDVVTRVREALVDTERSRGIDAIAQVDLGTRAHRHQSLRDLSGMATEILATALARTGAGPDVDERPPAVTLR
jgi:hypothetical protein